MLVLYTKGNIVKLPSKLLYDYNSVTLEQLKNTAKYIFDDTTYVELIYDEE